MMNQTVSDAGDALIRVRRVREGTGERPGCGRRPGAPEEEEDEGPQRAQKMHVSKVLGKTSLGCGWMGAGEIFWKIA